MSTPQAYHRPPAADEEADDDDLDLDLNELDPHTTTSTAARRQDSYDFGRHIPLRNLRFGGRRRAQNEDIEDDVDARKRESGHTSGDDDDAPLLSNGHTRTLSLPDAFAFDTGRRSRIWDIFHRSSPSLKDQETTRDITPGTPARSYPPNAISNAKYTAYNFLPLTLFHEFKFFFNLYFLLVALSQIIPALRIGYLTTYIAPLAFVVSITLGKEAYDDVFRRQRDNEANAEPYRVLKFDRDTGTNLSNGEGRKRKIRSIGQKKRGKRRRVDEQGLGEGVVEAVKPSKDLKVGDVIVLGKDQRVPADVVILKSFSTETLSSSTQDEGSSEAALLDIGDNATVPDGQLQREAASGAPLDNDTTSIDPSGGGEAFIRTDQLDGETDWKLRLASPLAQTLTASQYGRLRITAGKPDKGVNEFVGTIELSPKRDVEASYDSQINDDARSAPSPLTIDNTAWANTVLASSTTVHAVVIYTGAQTRAALSTSASRSKTGLLELEINSLTKILCFLTAFLSFILVAIHGFEDTTPGGTRPWYVAVMRFLILFSTIVPISLRVNLDLGKSVYAYFIHRDAGIPGTVVRTSTIPEDLGRIEFLLSDKTGTLTRNEMELRKVHVGTVSYAAEAMEEVAGFVRQAFEQQDDGMLWTPSVGSANKSRREIGGRVRDLVIALALCHNVTPTTEEDGGSVAYQASSPDEIAIVKWTEQVGLRLAHRDRKSITLQSTRDERTVVRVEILNLFPFTSESKRMGIIVRFVTTSTGAKTGPDEIVFFEKGADTVMTELVAANDWLDEETANMAREGLRTLVIARKNLSAQQYSVFSASYAEAARALHGRDAAMAKAVKQHLEHDLELLGVTGVEDKLQPHVKPSLELLRNAGIKIWMLTGDKVETARCIALSSKLVARNQRIVSITALKRKEAALDALHTIAQPSATALLIDGDSLALFLAYHRQAFISLAVQLPAVIACRCSPLQKAEIARLIRGATKKRIACVGDGGNDVSMIQAADVGVGIVGKEGRQASLAADFSITQFAHLTKLLVWHGRNSYKRSAKLAQFVIHRGLIISVCQTVFSIASRFEPVALYRDWLLVGYATVYTMMPVFSLVLDRDVDEGLANLYPELYKELTLGRSLSYKTFFIWVGISIYQGLIIQGGSEILVPSFASSLSPSQTADLATSPGFKRMVALSYTILIVNELVMVAAEITTWHPIMIFSIVGTAALYFASVPFLGGYFDLAFVVSWGFWWRFAAVSAASLVPVYGGKVIRRTVRPPSYRKVRGV